MWPCVSMELCLKRQSNNQIFIKSIIHVPQWMQMCNPQLLEIPSSTTFLPALVCYLISALNFLSSHFILGSSLTQPALALPSLLLSPSISFFKVSEINPAHKYSYICGLCSYVIYVMLRALEKMCINAHTEIIAIKILCASTTRILITLNCHTSALSQRTKHRHALANAFILSFTWCI